jgi:hypothetical protein
MCWRRSWCREVRRECVASRAGGANFEGGGVEVTKGRDDGYAMRRRRAGGANFEGGRVVEVTEGRDDGHVIGRWSAGRSLVAFGDLPAGAGGDSRRGGMRSAFRAAEARMARAACAVSVSGRCAASNNVTPDDSLIAAVFSSRAGVLLIRGTPERVLPLRAGRVGKRRQHLRAVVWKPAGNQGRCRARRPRGRSSRRSRRRSGGALRHDRDPRRRSSSNGCAQRSGRKTCGVCAARGCRFRHAANPPAAVNLARI